MVLSRAFDEDEVFCSLLASLLLSCADTRTCAHSANSKIANAAAPLVFNDFLFMGFSSLPLACQRCVVAVPTKLKKDTLRAGALVKQHLVSAEINQILKCSHRPAQLCRNS